MATNNTNLGSSYQERMFEAISIIANSEAQKTASNDLTVECIVVDNSRAAEGEYTIQYGQNDNKHTAFSNMTNLLKGMNVYVLVPGGDWNKQKFILGKKMTPTDSFIKSQRPFENYVDVTEDLVTTEESASLVANGPIWVTPLKTIDNIANGYSFTRMGVKADFKANLRGKKARMGHYGLFIEVTYERKDAYSNDASTDVIIYKLDSLDMVGNPYQYEVFTAQEKVIDISELGKIQSINLYFYQDADFINDSYAPLNDALPIMMGGKATGRYRADANLNADLFINNVYISLGYNESDFKTSGVVLYTGNSIQYSSYDGESISAEDIKKRNLKTIEARWVLYTEDEKDGILAIDHEEEIPDGAEIHWFRQTIDYEPPKEMPAILGKGWEEIPHFGADKLTLDFEPRINYPAEYLKCAIIYPTQAMCDDLIMNELSLLTGSPGDVDYDAAASTIRAKYKPVIITSAELGFTNILLPKDVSAVNMSKGLNIITDVENQRGKYFLYGPTNEIATRQDENLVRKLVAAYNPVIKDGLSFEKNATKIVWEIPLVNTMIAPPVANEDYVTQPGRGESTFKKDGETSLIIERTRQIDPSDPTKFLALNPYQNFKIKSYYMQNATNNTIKCTVTFDNGNVCTSETTLLFGQSGNSGTDATFVLGFENGANSVKFNLGQDATGSPSWQADPVIVTASLFDYENKDITANYSNIKWSWHSKLQPDNKEDALLLTTGGEGVPSNGCKITYNPKGDPLKALGYILKAEVQYRVTNNVPLNTTEVDSAASQTEQQDTQTSNSIGGLTQSAKEKIVTLTAFLPIPVNYHNASFAEAPNRIIYDSNGTNPAFYNNYLQLFKYDEEKKQDVALDGCEWVVGVDGEVSYDPQLDNYEGKTEEEIATMKEQQKMKANWKAYYPSVIISTEEYQPPNPNITETSFPVGKNTTIDVNENLKLISTVVANNIDSTSSDFTDNSGEKYITTTRTLEVKETFVLQDKNGVQLLSDTSIESFVTATDYLMQHGYKSVNNTETIIPNYTNNTIETLIIYILDITTTNSEGVPIESAPDENNDLGADGTPETVISVLGPKIQAPNMYYNNLKKCVYLNCYTYFEELNDDASEDAGVPPQAGDTNFSQNEDEDVSEDIYESEYDGYTLVSITSDTFSSAGTLYTPTVHYVPIILPFLADGVAEDEENGKVGYNESACYYIKEDPAEEIYDPLIEFEEDSEEDIVYWSKEDIESTYGAGTTIYIGSEVLEIATAYEDDKEYYRKNAGDEYEGNAAESDDIPGYNANDASTDGYEPPSYDWGQTDAYGNILPAPGKKFLAWSQPILIEQNRYPSAMLNNWNGELTIDEKNGTILSTMISAGKKEDDNSYTGVLIGDVTAAGTDSHTGVYGFEHGQQCYAFKDDGKAFIGKSGSGQINFDGNKGEIKSGGYERNGKSIGMMIDLDGGGTEDADKGPFIHMVGALGEVKLGTNSPYFYINVKDNLEDKDGKNLIYVDGQAITNPDTGEVTSYEKKYYLQTADFDTSGTINIGKMYDETGKKSTEDIKISDPKGFRLNLAAGSVEAYKNFSLNTLSVKKDGEQVSRWDAGIVLSSVGSESKPYLKITRGYGQHKVIITNDKGQPLKSDGTVETDLSKIPGHIENYKHNTYGIESPLVMISDNKMFLQSPNYDPKVMDTGLKISFTDNGQSGDENTVYINMKKTLNNSFDDNEVDDPDANSDSENETLKQFCQYCGQPLDENDECPNTTVLEQLEMNNSDNLTKFKEKGLTITNTTPITWNMVTSKKCCLLSRIYIKKNSDVAEKDRYAYFMHETDDGKAIYIYLTEVTYINENGEQTTKICWEYEKAYRDNSATYLSNVFSVFYCDYCGYLHKSTDFTDNNEFKKYIELTTNAYEENGRIPERNVEIDAVFIDCKNTEAEVDGKYKCVLKQQKTSVTVSSTVSYGDQYQVTIQPKSPYFAIKIKKGDANVTKHMFYAGQKYFYLRSDKYAWSNTNGTTGNGMYLRLSNGDSGACYLIGENGYIILSDASKKKTGSSYKHNQGLRQVVLSGSPKNYGYPIYIREASGWNANTKQASYAKPMYVSWSGAVYARAFYILDQYGKAFLFASGGDSSRRTRIPYFHYYSDNNSSKAKKARKLSNKKQVYSTISKIGSYQVVATKNK